MTIENCCKMNRNTYAISRQDSHLQTILDTLLNGIRQIFDQEISLSPENYMRYYDHVYDSCTSCNRSPSGWSRKCGGAQLSGKKVYDLLKRFLQEYVNDMRTLFMSISDEEVLLTRYANQWKLYQRSSEVLNEICSYLNQNWVKCRLKKGQEGIFEIYRLALVTWKEDLFSVLNERVTNAVLQCIEKERQGTSINRSVIGNVIDCFVELSFHEEDSEIPSLYKETFENQFISKTTAFYEAESAAFLSNITVTEYCKHVESRLEEEKQRVRGLGSSNALPYLHGSTADALKATCVEVLIEKQYKRLHSEFQNLLNNDRNEDLKRMYSLVALTPKNLPDLNVILETHILQQGTEAINKCSINEAANDPKIYIGAILDLYKKYNALVLTAFNNDKGFVTAMDKAFDKFINSKVGTQNTANKSAELLAKYCDLLLKKSARIPDDKELEDNLHEAMTVFKYIEEKDVFKKYYVRLLSKRLILDTSVSDDAEVSVISMLKQTCCLNYTIKLERIFQDMGISKDLNIKFKESLQTTNITLQLDFGIQVITYKSWPFEQTTSTFLLPSELQRCVEQFKNFYAGRHSGRKLDWLYHMSKGELNMNTSRNNASNTYILQASTFQMCILLQFNYQHRFTVQQLLDNTQSQLEILIQVLQILLKAKILTSNDNENALTKESAVELYLDYKNKRRRININQPLKTDLKMEQKAVRILTADDRKHLIKAAIVRTMKMRKQLNHTNLISEVISQLSTRFKPQVPDIKKSIDILIEKDYLERMKDDRNTYSYVA